MKNLLAYTEPLSVMAGDELEVFVSGEGEYRAVLQRLICADSDPQGPGFEARDLNDVFAGAFTAQPQRTQIGSYASAELEPAVDAVNLLMLCKPTLLRPEAVLAAFGEFELRLLSDGDLVVANGQHLHLRLQARVALNQWNMVGLSLSTNEVRLVHGLVGQGRTALIRPSVHTAALQTGFVGCRHLRLAARVDHEGSSAHFNGRLEAPTLCQDALTLEMLHLWLEHHNAVPALARWDFAQDMTTQSAPDALGGAPMRLHQFPTRGVTGQRWNATCFDWTTAPDHYASVHFHEDDLGDAGWRSSFTVTLPPDLPSGVYAVHLENETSSDDAVFFVRPSTPTSSIAFLVPTFSYLAYANPPAAMISPDGRERTHENEVFLRAHPEVGYSLYETHHDRSGVVYSSAHRPILNLKPHNRPWQFVMDSYIIAWLEREGFAVDVITDQELHAEGRAALEPYRVVLTGSHPEYTTTAMRDGLEQYLHAGGRLMYLGGNGFYWRTAVSPDDPGIIEVRRAEDGTRPYIAEPGEYTHAFGGERGGLWRRLGHAPNTLVGVGMAAQGFERSTHYRLHDEARDPRAAFIFEGVPDQTIGAHGLIGGGAAGQEYDRFDHALGTPPHALRLASSENHAGDVLRTKEELLSYIAPFADKKSRADLVFFETPNGGAVFSVGSIAWAGSLHSVDRCNDISCVTRNVLERFDDPEPFALPDAALEYYALHSSPSDDKLPD
jgi:N,N-dimethylformamidase